MMKPEAIVKMEGGSGREVVQGSAGPEGWRDF